MPSFSSVQVIDSHTAGEPTRIVIEGGPDLGRGAKQQAPRIELVGAELEEARRMLKEAMANRPQCDAVEFPSAVLA